MNGSKAKKIRKRIYGEMSTRNVQYETEDRISLIQAEDKLKRVKTGTRRCIGLRAEYLKAKREAT